MWIRKVALRNSPVGCFIHRGFAAAKRIHHRTGRHACGSAVVGLHQTLKLGTRHIRRKERSFDSEINLHRLFGTIYCRLRCYLVGAHSMRPGSAKSYGRGRTMFAPTVQPVQMNLQMVCRGRTSGHLLLRLCRNSPWHTLRKRLCTPKKYSRS